MPPSVLTTREVRDRSLHNLLRRERVHYRRSRREKSAVSLRSSEEGKKNDKKDEKKDREKRATIDTRLCRGTAGAGRGGGSDGERACTSERSSLLTSRRNYSPRRIRFVEDCRFLGISFARKSDLRAVDSADCARFAERRVVESARFHVVVRPSGSRTRTNNNGRTNE